ncbi:MAG: carbohydrate kinase family protein [Gemmatimonadota bacterium]|nr:MAG: carbohydrate kinase family protein [Gemmatimonadota bacterium]
MKRLGVLGTMVWDTIYGRGADVEPVEEWGGICYALAALEAGLPDDWELVPLIKVGSDFAARANQYLTTVTHRAAAARFVEVCEPNNQVTLRYDELNRVAEHMSGGVPSWRWEELGPMVRDLDALYVNFISGFELQIETACHLRRGFAGPIYADLHSLFLAVERDGRRTPQPLADIATWFSCFDAIQLNEDEMALVGSDPMEVAALALGTGVGLLIVTLGPLGAVYFAVPSFDFMRRPSNKRPDVGPVSTARIPKADVTDVLDPTGCGDVFGATIVSNLVQSVGIEEAVRRANRYAARNLSYRGASHLHHHLRGEIVQQ